ncbi:MAG: SWIM zinc finger family protein [Leptolyngbya sp.]|nr:SWIM zinc finger family protein [Candidatus Melainabacteria bacterium]
MKSADHVEALVEGSDVSHQVKLTLETHFCSCPWHSKHQGFRGPCKHVLAVMLMGEENLDN